MPNKQPPAVYAGMPHPVVEFDAIDSTNNEGHRRAAAGERGPLWLRADRQLSGRGRSGRQWASPAGNFSATFLFTPEGAEPAVYHHLSFVSGVAAWDALNAAGADAGALQLKWPNDLMMAGAKLGGILVESSRYDGRGVLLVGIGINLSVAPPVPGREVTQLAAHGVATTPADLLRRLGAAMEHWLAAWDGGRGFPAVREAWLARAHPIGSRVTVTGRDTSFAGTFQGIGCDGNLELSSETGELLSVTHGDVSLVRGQERDGET